MKLSIITATALSLGQARAACKADNCARAVTGTFRGASSAHAADCSSFQLCVFPTPTITQFAVSQVLTTTTITAPLTNPPWLFPLEARGKQKKRRAAAACPNYDPVCPTQVPAYASACQGSSRYSSACSCAGYDRQFSVPAPSFTIATITDTLQVYEFVLTEGTSTTVTDITLPNLVNPFPFQPVTPC